MQKTSLMVDTVMESIKNKIIIIAGASGGIGFATARRLAARGARLILAGRESTTMRALLDELRTQGADCTMFCRDLAGYDSWHRLLEFTNRQYGRLDALVHCIGILIPEPFLQLAAADIAHQSEINFTSVVYLKLSIFQRHHAQQRVFRELRARSDPKERCTNERSSRQQIACGESMLPALMTGSREQGSRRRGNACVSYNELLRVYQGSFSWVSLFLRKTLNIGSRPARPLSMK